jgi:hypothetical protein
MAARIIEHGAPTGDGHSMLCPDKANDGSRRDAGATKCEDAGLKPGAT